MRRPVSFRAAAALLLLLALSAVARADEYAVGVIAPLSGLAQTRLFGPRIAHGALLALRDAADPDNGWFDGLFRDSNHTVVAAPGGVKDSAQGQRSPYGYPYPHQAALGAVELVEEDAVVALLGPMWSEGSIAVASYGAAKGVPVLSPSNDDAEFSDKALFPFFSRAVPSETEVASGLAALVRTFGWGAVAVVSTSLEIDSDVAALLVDALEAAGVATREIYFASGDADDAAEAVDDLLLFGDGVRVVVLVTAHADARLVLAAADGLGMFDDDDDAPYVWVGEAWCSAMLWEGLFPYTSIRPDAAMKPLADGAVCMRATQLEAAARAEWFAHLNSTGDLGVGAPLDLWADADDVHIDSLLGYNAGMIVAHAISAVLQAGGDPADGDALNAALRDVSFGLPGYDVSLDAATGDAFGSYEFFNLRHDEASDDMGIHTFATYTAAADATNITLNATVRWQDGSYCVVNASGACVGDVPAALVPHSCDAGYILEGYTCSPCAPGTFFDQDTGACAACSKGEFQSGFAALACLPCAPGNYSADAGATQCARCPPGSFAADEGSSACSRCDTRSYQPRQEADACLACPAHSVAGYGADSLDQCECEAGYFQRGDADAVCEECPEGAECAGAGAAPVPSEGFWSTADDPLVLWDCGVDGACPGGAPDTCADDRHGFLCGQCDDGHYLAAGGCHQCSVPNRGALAAAVASVVMAFCLGVYVFTNNRHLDRARRLVGISSAVGLLVTYVQILAVFTQGWPESVRRLAGLLTVLNFDLDWLQYSCFTGAVPYRLRLLARFALPVVLVLAFALLLAVGLLRQHHAKRKQGPELGRRRRVAAVDTWIEVRLNAAPYWSTDGMFNATGATFELLFIFIITSSLQTFGCYRHPNGQQSLRVAPEVICFSDEWYDALPVALTGSLVYGAGVLALFAHSLLLAPREHVATLTKIRFLLARFRPDKYAWSLVSLGRKLLLAVVATLMSFNATLQASCFALVLVVSLAVQVRHAPFFVKSANVLDLTLHLNYIGLVLCSFCFVSGDVSEEVTAGLVIALVALALTASVGVVLLEAFRVRSTAVTEHTRLLVKDFERTVGSLAGTKGMLEWAEVTCYYDRELMVQLTDSLQSAVLQRTAARRRSVVDAVASPKLKKLRRNKTRVTLPAPSSVPAGELLRRRSSQTFPDGPEQQPSGGFEVTPIVTTRARTPEPVTAVVGPNPEPDFDEEIHALLEGLHELDEDESRNAVYRMANLVVNRTDARRHSAVTETRPLSPTPPRRESSAREPNTPRL